MACYSIQEEIGMMAITFVVMAGAIIASAAYTVYKFDRMRRLAREIELQVEASYAEAKMTKDTLHHNTVSESQSKISQDLILISFKFQHLRCVIFVRSCLCY